MKILFLHGWNSLVGGVKPTYLAQHGYEVINPALPDDNMEEAVRIAQAEFDKHQPQVVVGSSRGGAVALNINSGDAKLVLLCPAWKKYGTARTTKQDIVILHSRADDVVPFADSEELAKISRATLIEVGTDHRLADPEPLAAILKACESSVGNEYDHHAKAGNQGDVVKHVALTSALDMVLDDFPAPMMRYADLFAGYSSSKLTAENKANDGWSNGVGAIIARRARFAENRHIDWWANRYLMADDLNGSDYPGSAVIASEVCDARHKSISLGLWDIKSAVVRDLRQRFGVGDHVIFHRSAEPGEDIVRDANFIFIDPPGIKSDVHPEYPAWKTLRQFIELRRPGQSLLMWLPVKAVTSVKAAGKGKGVMEAMKPPGEDDPSWVARNDAIRMGCRGLRVRWARGGRTIGCHLIYFLSEKAENAMRAAVEKVVELAGWNDDLPNGVQSVIL